jgi:hypothetical protein
VSTVLYQCTECDSVHPSLVKAGKCHEGIGGVEKVAPRPLSVIAAEIAADWRPVWFGAVPYLRAMLTLDSTDELLRTTYYGADRADEIVLRFIGNSRTWKGDTARRIKAELRARLAAESRG